MVGTLQLAGCLVATALVERSGRKVYYDLCFGVKPIGRNRALCCCDILYGARIVEMYIKYVFINLNLYFQILLSSSCAVVCLCMVGIATVFLFDYLHLSPLPQWLPVVSASLCIFAYGIGLGPIPFIVMAELFSFQVRISLMATIQGLMESHVLRGCYKLRF